jgi:hypothetical protein
MYIDDYIYKLYMILGPALARQPAEDVCGVRVSATDRPPATTEHMAYGMAHGAKRALRKMFKISMPFCLIPCRHLLDSPCSAPRATTARFASAKSPVGCRGRARGALRLRAHGRLLGRASRAGVSATPVAVSQSFLPVSQHAHQHTRPCAPASITDHSTRVV